MGGVGRNLAAALELLGHEPVFISALADDTLGRLARDEMRKLIDRSIGDDSPPHSDDRRCQPPIKPSPPSTTTATRFKAFEWTGNGSEPSSCFALVLIDQLTGQCEYVIANVEARRAISRQNLEHLFLGPEVGHHHHHQGRLASLADTPLFVLDANTPAEAIGFVLELAHQNKLPVFLEPTDVNCLPELVGLLRAMHSGEGNACRRALACMSPNAIELETMLKLFSPTTTTTTTTATTTITQTSVNESPASCIDSITAIARELMQRHLPELSLMLVTLDSNGLLVGLRTELEHIDSMRPYRHLVSDSAPPERLVFKHYPPTELIQSPVSASGAGDCFAAGFVSGLIRDLTLAECVELAFAASKCALLDSNTVPESLAALAMARRGASGGQQITRGQGSGIQLGGSSRRTC